MFALLFAAALAAQPAPKADVSPLPPGYSAGHADQNGYAKQSGSVRGGETYTRQTYQGEATYAAPPYDDPRQPAYNPPAPYPDAYGKAAGGQGRAYTGDPAYYNDPNQGRGQPGAPAYQDTRRYDGTGGPPPPALDYYYGKGDLGPALPCQKAPEPYCEKAYNPPAPPPVYQPPVYEPPVYAPKPPVYSPPPPPVYEPPVYSPPPPVYYPPAPPPVSYPQPCNCAPPPPPPPPPCNCAPPPPCNYYCGVSWEQIRLDDGFVTTAMGGIGGYPPPVSGGGGGGVVVGGFAGAGAAANAASSASASASANVNVNVRVTGGGGHRPPPPPPHGGGGCKTGCGGGSHGGGGYSGH